MKKNKRSILVVDDANFTRKKIISILNNKPNYAIFDVESTEACNGKEALDALLNQDIDIVLLDINMPIMNGIDLLYELENRNLKKKIAILTADTSVTLEELSEFGIENLLFKPFKAEVLWKVLIEFNEELVWGEYEENPETQLPPRREKKVISKDTNIESPKTNKQLKKEDSKVKGVNIQPEDRKQKVKDKPIDAIKEEDEVKGESTNRIVFDKIRKELKERNSKQDKEDNNANISKPVELQERNIEPKKELKEDVKKEVKRQKRQMSLDIKEEIKKPDKGDKSAPCIDKKEQPKKDALKRNKKLAEILPKTDFAEEVKEDFEMEIEANIDDEVNKEAETEFVLEDFEDNENSQGEVDFVTDEELSKEDEIEFEIDDLESEISNDFVENIIGINGDEAYISEVDEGRLIKDLKAAKESEYQLDVELKSNESDKSSENDNYAYETFTKNESDKSDDITFVLDDSDESEEEFEIDINYDDVDSVDILPPMK